MRFQTLADWLHWQEGLHPELIELGLERVGRVFKRLHPSPPHFKVITVAGTNGKGSSVTLLHNIYSNAGYAVGSYTSPHLISYNERIRINTELASDESICEAFTRVDEARGDISLTYFEFGTLAALDIFYRSKLDIAILEVGLGGRLDAVNIIDADVALISSIGIDHQAWLGSDRETIAREKAGIMRASHPVVYADPDMPESINAYASEIGASLYRFGHDFHIEKLQTGWQWHSDTKRISGLPIPAMRGEHQYNNAAGVLMCVQCLQAEIPVDTQALRAGLLTTQVSGRFQVLPGAIPIIYDVAHNSAAVERLVEMLRAYACDGRTHAVFGAFKDKDIADMVQLMGEVVSAWYPCTLPGHRGASAQLISEVIRANLPHALIHPGSPDSMHALKMAQGQARPGDRILVFGSFSTVAEALPKGI